MQSGSFYLSLFLSAQSFLFTIAHHTTVSRYGRKYSFYLSVAVCAVLLLLYETEIMYELLQALSELLQFSEHLNPVMCQVIKTVSSQMLLLKAKPKF